MDESRIILECKHCAWRGPFSTFASKTKTAMGIYVVENRQCPNCDGGLWITSTNLLAERKD